MRPGGTRWWVGVSWLFGGLGRRGWRAVVVKAWARAQARGRVARGWAMAEGSPWFA